MKKPLTPTKYIVIIILLAQISPKHYILCGLDKSIPYFIKIPPLWYIIWKLISFVSIIFKLYLNIYSIYYPTVAGRVVDSQLKNLSVDTSLAEHTITITPNDPAIVFEKVVIDAGGYQRSYLFMDESEVTKK